jgi:hypothetical protein
MISKPPSHKRSRRSRQRCVAMNPARRPDAFLSRHQAVAETVILSDAWGCATNDRQIAE